jgi:serine/threonine protein kinase
MTDARWSERSIFEAAIDKGSREERAAYLDQVCGSNPALRQDVEALLAAHDRLGSISAATTVDERTTEGAGTVIGPYKLLEQIGEGGFGVVFMAEKQEPIRRKVALKVLKPGMDTRQVIARFEAERQALAIMDHPNIAKVLDAGATDSGRPYFVMELVKGIPITDYCDQNQLATQERLELFRQVCQAVQHAHQKGIIHRDLKPSNVLVTLQDGTPLVKIIDFGIAKAMGQPLTDKSLFTGFAHLVGTPLYMSPEQAALSNVDVDTRSDIYSLGVLLYELLTGTTPFDKKRLKTVGFDELRRIIREEEPPRPSTRISTIGQAETMASEKRQSDPRKLSRLFRGELDWIMMKALEKDRNRRYETASAFAADVERYLTDEPVLACPPSRGYRLGKLMRKHRAAALAAAAFVGLLLTGAAVSTWQAVRATKAEHLAQVRLRQIEKANAVLASVLQDFDLSAEEKGGPKLREQLRQRLLEAVDHLNAEPVGDPLTEARLQDTLGVTLCQLGDYREAIDLLERARATRAELLGPNNPDTLASMDSLARAYEQTGDRDKAVSLYEQVLEKRKSVLGADDPRTMISMNNLALAYAHSSQWDRAVPLFEETVQLRKTYLGSDHPDTLLSMSNLGNCYRKSGHLPQATSLLEEVLDRAKKRPGGLSDDLAMDLSRLAYMYDADGQFTKAEPLHREFLKRIEKQFGPHDVRIADALAGLGENLLKQEKYADAEAVFRQCLDIRAKELPSPDFRTFNTQSLLGGALVSQKKYVEAEPLLLRGYEGLRRRLGDDATWDQAELRETAGRLVRLYEAIGDPENAAKWRRRRDAP